MFINKLDMQNFCNIRNRTFSFNPGINLITGTNGSGKSSILKALSFLLLNSTEKTISDYVNWDAKAFHLGLDLQLDGKPMTITASWEGKTSTRSLETPQEHSYRNSEVTEFLAKKFDPTLCKYSSFSSQGDLDFIYATPAIRRDLLKTIYSLEFDAEIQRLDDEMGDIKTKMAELNKQRLTIEAELSVEEFELEALPFSDDAYLEKKERHALLEERRSTIQKAIDTAATVVDRHKQRVAQLHTLYAQLIEMRNTEVRTLERATRLQKTYTVDYTADETHIAQLEAKLAAIVIRRIPESIPEQADLEAVHRRLVLAVADAERADRDSKSILSGVCPTCQKAYTPDDIEKHKAVVQQAHQLVNTLLAEQDHLEGIVNKYLADKTENLRQHEERTTLATSIAQAASALQEKKESHRISLTEATESVKNSQAQLDSIESQIASLDAQIEKLTASAPVDNDLVKRESELVVVAADLEALDKQILQYEQIKHTNEKVEDRNRQLRDKKARLVADADALTVQNDALLTQNELLEACKNVMKKDLPNFILERLAVGLETSANEFLDRAYNGKYHIKLMESKSGIEVVYGEKAKPVVLASGAEKSLINLGIKLGLAKLSGMGVLFLDEVDAYMADEIATEVFAVFEELIAEKFINQVFVISHKETVKELLEERFNATVFQMEG